MHRPKRIALAAIALIAGCECRTDPREPSPMVAVPPLPTSDHRAAVADALIGKLAPMHEKKRAPEPGDWLAEHAEAGQSYRQWLAADPVLPDLEPGPGQRSLIYIQPLGSMSGARARVVELATEYLELFFGLPAETREPLSLSLVPPQARRRHPIEGNPQILSAFVLDELLAPRLPANAAAYISFTSADLWPGQGWNYVYGQASLRRRVAVWSVKRQGDPDRGPPAFRRALRRTLKVAVHETGHMFSMRHCTAYRCVMNGVQDQEEADRVPPWLCPECLAKVLYATGQNAEDRYRRLAAFAERHGLEAEATFFDRAARRLP